MNERQQILSILKDESDMYGPSSISIHKLKSRYYDEYDPAGELWSEDFNEILLQLSREYLVALTKYDDPQRYTKQEKSFGFEHHGRWVDSIRLYNR